ncbi:MAG: hypothetical protein ACRCYY_06150 [Trueperaceae bacterium]
MQHLTLTEAVRKIRLEKLERKETFTETQLHLEARKRYPHLKQAGRKK